MCRSRRGSVQNVGADGLRPPSLLGCGVRPQSTTRHKKGRRWSRLVPPLRRLGPRPRPGRVAAPLLRRPQPLRRPPPTLVLLRHHAVDVLPPVENDDNLVVDDTDGDGRSGDRTRVLQDVGQSITGHPDGGQDPTSPNRNQRGHLKSPESRLTVPSNGPKTCESEFLLTQNVCPLVTRPCIDFELGTRKTWKLETSWELEKSPDFTVIMTSTL